MVFLKTEEEIELLRKANHVVAEVLSEISRAIKPGVLTKDLDNLAETCIRDHGGIPTFKGYPGLDGTPFPASICTSVNDVVVHGIPNDTSLKEGDIVSVDCGVCLNGYNGDSCYTFEVGEVDPKIRAFLRVAKESLYKGIDQAVTGRRLGDIGNAIQTYCEQHAYGVVREFVGHGIGRDMHEDPQVPNYGRRGNGLQLKNGLCIAIEPMVTLGDRHIKLSADGWTVKTVDGSIAAHFEHSIAIHQGKADILSSFEGFEE